jgi:hypothetical protein
MSCRDQSQHVARKKKATLSNPATCRQEHGEQSLPKHCLVRSNSFWARLAHLEVVPLADLAIHLALVCKVNGEVQVAMVLLVGAAVDSACHRLALGNHQMVVDVTHRLPPVRVGGCQVVNAA